MKNSIIRLTFLIVGLILITGCGGDSGSSSGPEPDPTPEITSVNPSEGPVGALITINGSNFSDTPSENTVTFNGTQANVDSATSSRIKTTVPDNATSGAVVVSVNGQTANGPAFSVNEEMPAITSVSPDSGLVGTRVTISGMNFSDIPSGNTVTFNGVNATVSDSSNTNEIITEVPQGASDGPIEVTVEENAATGPAFNVITTGSLQLRTFTQRSDPDAGDYSFNIDGSLAGLIGTTDTVDVTGLEEGMHSIELVDVAETCNVDDENPKTVDIVAGETASVIFDVACSEILKNKIVFTSDRDTDPTHIYSVNPDSTGLKRITDSEFRAVKEYPVISNDGTQIAFISRRDGNVDNIFVMNADGTDVQRITDFSGGNMILHSWSPDDSRLAFSGDAERFRDQEIFTINADGTDLQQLTDNEKNDIDPDWSPDGNRIIFASARTNQNQRDDYDLFVMDTDGSNVQQLTSDDNNSPDPVYIDPRWSPDGSGTITTVSTAGSRSDRYPYWSPVK